MAQNALSPILEEKKCRRRNEDGEGRSKRGCSNIVMEDER